MLKIEDLSVAYDGYQVLWDVSLHIQKGEIVCLLGPNGAGKSTILNTISGIVRPTKGRVWLGEERMDRLKTPQIIKRGISHVLERHRVFPYLTVMENLQLGAYLRKAKVRQAETLAWVLELFPILAQRREQPAGQLSGGEQQMLAIGRGLMSNPEYLLIDEPFLGLAPLVVEHLLEIMQLINHRGVTILFVEQNVELAVDFADRAYVLASGQVVAEGKGLALIHNERVQEVYLGRPSP